MILLSFFASASALFVLWVRRQDPERVGRAALVRRAGSLLALARVGFVWFALLAGSSFDSVQILAYLMLVGTLPEALLVQSLAGRPLLWGASLSLLVTAGSFLWVAFLVALARGRGLLPRERGRLPA